MVESCVIIWTNFLRFYFFKNRAAARGMQFFSLAIAILFTFLTLILAFENLFAKASFLLILFAPADAIPPFFLILIITILGVIAGVFYTLFVMELKKSRASEDVSDDEVK